MALSGLLEAEYSLEGTLQEPTSLSGELSLPTSGTTDIDIEIINKNLEKLTYELDSKVTAPFVNTGGRTTLTDCDEGLIKNITFYNETRSIDKLELRICGKNLNYATIERGALTSYLPATLPILVDNGTDETRVKLNENVKVPLAAICLSVNEDYRFNVLLYKGGELIETIAQASNAFVDNTNNKYDELMVLFLKEDNSPIADDEIASIEFQIEYGDVTDYEPYYGQEYICDLTEEAVNSLDGIHTYYGFTNIISNVPISFDYKLNLIAWHNTIVDFDVIYDDINLLEGNINTLGNNIDTLENNINELESSISNNDTKFDDIQTDLDVMLDMCRTKINSNEFKNDTTKISAIYPFATQVESYGFYGCTALKNVYLPNVTFVSSGFDGCTALTSIDLPNVTKLSGGFNRCTALTDVNLPKVTYIGYGTFNNCTALKNVYAPNAERLPSSGCFKGCSSLETIDLPNVYELSSYSFEGCTSLKNVNLPKVKIISEDTFRNCSSLTTLNFPSLTNIYNNGLRNISKLKTLILPRSEGIVTLASVKSLVNTPIGNKASDAGIYVPRALIESYKANATWSTYSNLFKAIEDYPEICNPTEDKEYYTKQEVDNLFNSLIDGDEVSY